MKRPDVDAQRARAARHLTTRAMKADAYDLNEFYQCMKANMSNIEELVHQRATRDVECALRQFIEMLVRLDGAAWTNLDETDYRRPFLWAMAKKCHGFKTPPEIMVRCCGKNAKGGRCQNPPRLGGFFTCDRHVDQEPNPELPKFCQEVDRDDRVEN